MPRPGPSKHCGAGSSGIAVDPYGNVYPCVQWRRPVGNLHRQTIREIWHGSADLAEVRRTHRGGQGEARGRRPGGQLLNFCPGLAAATSGDPLELYAGAEQRRDLLRQVARERGAVLPVLP